MFGAGVLGFIVIRIVDDVLGVLEKMVVDGDLLVREGVGDVVGADDNVEGIIADGAETVHVVAREQDREVWVVQNGLVIAVAQGQEGQVLGIAVGIEGSAAIVHDGGDVDAGVVSDLLSVQGVQSAGQAFGHEHLVREMQGDAALGVGHIREAVRIEVTIIREVLFGKGGGAQGCQHQHREQNCKKFLHFLSPLFFMGWREYSPGSVTRLSQEQISLLFSH